MNDTPLLLLARTILKDRLSEFTEQTALLQQEGSQRFVGKHMELLEPLIDVEYYEDNDEEIDDILVLLMLGMKYKLIAGIDWSGEEYPGQVQECIETMLAQQQKTIKWSDQQFPVEQLKRDEFLPRLFRALNADLEAEGFALGLIDIKDDQYYFFVLPADELATINGLAADSFSVTDSKLYDLFLPGKNGYPGKVILFIKNKFQVNLAEAKAMLEQGDVLVETGNLAAVNSSKKQLEELGASVKIAAHSDL
jgi:ribosomal protein L7/L12